MHGQSYSKKTDIIELKAREPLANGLKQMTATTDQHNTRMTIRY